MYGGKTGINNEIVSLQKDSNECHYSKPRLLVVGPTPLVCYEDLRMLPPVRTGSIMIGDFVPCLSYFNLQLPVDGHGHLTMRS